MRNYYDVLGVRPDASLDEIKHAYKDLARRSHPDANPGSSAAEEAFKELSGAYAVLSDPSSRVLYDVYGPAAFREGRPRHSSWSGGSAPAGEVPPPALYLTAMEMAGGCAKVLPVPCAACGGHGWDIGLVCPSCGGRGWSPLGPRVRIEVPPGVGPGQTLWGEVLSGDGDPIPFTVQIRRTARATTRTVGADVHQRNPAPSTSPAHGFAQAKTRATPSAKPAETSPGGNADPAAPGGFVRLFQGMRRRCETGTQVVARRMKKTIDALSEPAPYPLAVQLAAVARALERVGDRQVLALEGSARRFSAEVVRLGQLLPADSARPPAERVAERLSAGWNALRLAVFAMAGALVLGTLSAWLLATTIRYLGPAAGVLPGPLAVVNHGWAVGLGLVSLTVLAGVARRLLGDMDSDDVIGFVIENAPGILLLALLALTGRIFWQAAPIWLERLGLAAGDAATDPLQRSAVAGAGALLFVGLYALGVWSALGITRAARVRAQLLAAELLAERERRLQRARAVGLHLKELAQIILAGVKGLPEAVRKDFERAAGIPASGSVAESVDRLAQALLGSAPPPEAPIAVRDVRGALARFAVDLLVCALWVVGVLVVATSLAPATPAWATGGSLWLARLAALALPLTASLAGLVAKEGMRRASQAALSYRAAPWLGRPITVGLAVAAVAALAVIAGWVEADYLPASGAGIMPGVWVGMLVVAVAVTGVHLDAALLAATRLASLMGLGAAWVAVRLAGAWARISESALRLASGGVPEEPPADAPDLEQPQRRSARRA